MMISDSGLLFWPPCTWWLVSGEWLMDMLHRPGFPSTAVPPLFVNCYLHMWMMMLTVS